MGPGPSWGSFPAGLGQGGLIHLGHKRAIEKDLSPAHRDRSKTGVSLDGGTCIFSAVAFDRINGERNGNFFRQLEGRSAAQIGWYNRLPLGVDIGPVLDTGLLGKVCANGIINDLARLPLAPGQR
ncbi:MAG: hypothetical protein FD149_1482 [Rhodospirillaceae bacterium]|nr:MAG: hypothetical protein FD149_1482 [Rhodospirillaceae bacterium]